MSTVWNSADKTSNIVLSNTSHTASISGTPATNEGVRAIGVTHNSGKWYLEFNTIASGGASGWYGVANAATVLGTGGTIGVDPNGFLHGGTSSSPGSSPTGHTLGLAIDLDNNLVWATIDGVNWTGATGGTPNPNTGAFGLAITGVTGPHNPYLWEQGFATAHATLNCGDSAFTFTIPAGFTGWDAPPPLPPQYQATVMS